MMELVNRPRRLRISKTVRDLVSETLVDSGKLIMPYFVCEGKGVRVPIKAMPGIDRVSPDNLVRDIERDLGVGITTILIFGIPDKKDEVGSEAYSDNGIVQRAIREIKQRLPELFIITDVCLCEYTNHGHCGLVEGDRILNDPTLDLLAKTAVSQAIAGADMVAPSDMMDGRVAAIRNALDQEGYTNIAILSYAAKYASSFYGPFREAAASAPRFSDRRSYQVDYRNASDAIREVIMDIEEGADIVMVKPALSYLDIIYRIKQIVNVPVCAYNVSGEYSMVKEAGRLGFGDEQGLVTEILTSIFRSGADMIISYHTRDILKNKWF